MMMKMKMFFWHFWTMIKLALMDDQVERLVSTHFDLNQIDPLPSVMMKKETLFRLIWSMVKLTLVYIWV